MKILMTGPGKGHNVQRFLKWFNQRPDEYEFYYHHYNKAEHYPLESFQNLNFISTYEGMKLAQAIHKADLIWVHNWTPWPFLMLILAFKQKRAVLSFNFWSEKLPREILSGNNFKSKFYRYFFSKCHVLQTSWYSVKDLVDQFGHPNSRLMRWGFEEEYFEPVKEGKLSKFALDFVKDLPGDVFKFFVPKTIGFPNRHDLMVEAAGELVAKGIEDFCIYFWKGNRVETKVEEKILEMIHDSKLEKQVKLVNHPFLSNRDMVYIWQHMDAGLQLCDQDQLSSAFTEPQLFKKQVIASEIESYQLYNDFYDVKIPLVSNSDLMQIADAMEEAITQNEHPEELRRRQDIIKTHYRFSNNMEEMMSYFYSLYHN